MYRVICEIRPCFIVVENVAAITFRGLGTVLRDLAAIRYDAEWDVLPACAFGASQPRERLFLISYPSGTVQGSILQSGRARHPQIKPGGFSSYLGATQAQRWPSETQPRLVRMANGVSPRMDDRGRALGNAIVPQVAEWIGRRIVEADGA